MISDGEGFHGAEEFLFIVIDGAAEDKAFEGCEGVHSVRAKWGVGGVSMKWLFSD